MGKTASSKASIIMRRAFTFTALAVCVSAGNQALADEGGARLTREADERAKAVEPALSTVVVTGSRKKGRTVADSSVPIDVVAAESLEEVSSGDLNDKLSKLVPSYQVQRNTIADGNIFFRTATLRNLSPDHTLVLVNGKRRHRSAFINSAQLGAQAVDLNQIPSIALKQVEVLRDGAAAQYGSDAIAGVINLIPDDSVGFRAFAQTGQYYKGDGENHQGGFNLGIPVADRGSINLSLEYNNAARTNRGNQAIGAQALTDNGGAYGSSDFYQQNIKDPVQRFGQPDQENYRSFLNLKLDLNDTTEVYAFGSYSEAAGENDFIWRNPETNGYFNPLPVWGNYSLRSRYPGGFTPIFGMDTKDSDFVLGIKGAITDRWSWDLSGRYGRNEIEYSMKNTINASLGPQSPTSFDAGTREQIEHGVNLDFVYDAYDFIVPTSVAFGTEYREEEYTAGTGEWASYALGPGAAFGYAGGSNGFFGTDPTQAGTYRHSSVAAYLDIDSQITDKWQVGAATRYENYTSDAGSSTTGKLTTRYELIPGLAFRGSLSTGFRAPTPGQANFTNTSQRPSPDSTTILTQGTIPSTNPVALLRGGKALKPERSHSLSAGFTTELSPSTQLTVDYYNIEVKDRLGLSPNSTLTDTERAALLASGVTMAQGLDTFNFYVNGFTTNTQGVDVVLTQQYAFAQDVSLNVTALYNYNRTHVTDADDGVVSDLTRQSLQDRLPRHKASLTFDARQGKTSAMLRGTYYSSWTQPFFDEVSTNQKFGAEVFWDASVSYQATQELKVTLGAENIFDNYPGKEKNLARLGTKYPLYRPYDADGGSYFLRLDYSI